jgi:hypothetical protein
MKVLLLQRDQGVLLLQRPMSLHYKGCFFCERKRVEEKPDVVCVLIQGLPYRS